jgi:competence protein ComEA
MRKSLHAVLAAIIVAIFTSAAFAADAQASAAPSGVVNINTADAAQLSLLPRVGAKAAERIVDYRKEHGAFKKTTDLMQVRGFGEKSFERLSSYVTVSGATTLTAKIKSPSTRKAKGSSTHKSPSPAR